MSYREVSEIRDGMRIDWDMPIKMDDGIVLRCDVYRPVKPGTYPVILTYGPYGKWLHFEDLYTEQWQRMCENHPDVPTGSTNKYQCWEVVDPEKWVPDGYVCVRVDSRGAGRSPGVIDIWSLREAQDLAHCVEWAGVQPWSNGKVGLNGISYYAENQWQCAALQPKHLAAICLWEGAADFYRDMAHHGGIFCNGFTKDWSRVAGLHAAARPRQARLQEPHERRLGVGPDRADRGGARRQPPQFLRGLPRPQARHRRVLAVAHAGLVEGEGAAVLGRQLGRPGPASARQLRGLRARRLEAEVARSATASSTGRISTPTTASRCRRSSSAISSRARRPAGTSSRRCCCRCVTSTSSSSGTRRNGRSSARKWTKFFLDPADFSLSTKRQAKKASRHLRGPRRRRHLPDRAAEAGHRDHRADRRQAVGVVGDRGRRPVPGGARVLARHEGDGVPGRARSAHAARAGLAARLAPQARQEAHPALPALSHPRRGAEAQEGRGRTRSTSRSGRPASWCRRAIASR